MSLLPKLDVIQSELFEAITQIYTGLNICEPTSFFH